MNVVYKRNVIDSITQAMESLVTPTRWNEKLVYLMATLEVEKEVAQIFMLAIATREHLIDTLREKTIPRELAKNVNAVLLLSQRQMPDEDLKRKQFKLEQLVIASQAVIMGVMKCNTAYGIMLALEEIRIWIEVYEQNKYLLLENPDKDEFTLSFTYFQQERKELPKSQFPSSPRPLYDMGLLSPGDAKNFECRFNFYASDIRLINKHLNFLADTLKQPLAVKLGIVDKFKRPNRSFVDAIPSYNAQLFVNLAKDIRSKVFSFMDNIPSGQTILPNSIYAEAKTLLDLSDVRQASFAAELGRFAKQDLNPRTPMFASLKEIHAAIGKEKADVLDVYLEKMEVSERNRMTHRLKVMNPKTIGMLVDKMDATLSQKGLDVRNTKIQDIMDVTFNDPWCSLDSLLKALYMKGVTKRDCKQIENRIFEEAARQEIPVISYLIRVKEYFESSLDKFIAAATEDEKQNR